MISNITLESEVMMFITVSFPLYLLAFTLYILRAIKPPTVPDMVIAVDALGYDLAAFLPLLSILFKSPILIPCAIVLALWIYALDIYVAKYLEARELGE